MRSTEHSRSMAQLHLIIGPVGAGKSTFARQLGREHAALALNLDEWMARLFRPDRPDSGVMEWYQERTDRCIEQIWRLAIGLLAVGSDVVLEIGLIQHSDRQRFYARVDAAGCKLTIFVLDPAREVRRARVQQRNQVQGDTFAMEVPPHIFELASDMWQPPDEEECRGRDVRFIDTDAPGPADPRT
jgi:predicted kinase